MFPNATPVVIRRALTRVEVVVVVVCAVSLTLLAVTALGVVKGSSKQSRCLSNLARIGYANLIYSAQDPSGMALPVHGLQGTPCPEGASTCRPRFQTGAYEWGGKSGIGQTDGTFEGADPNDPLNSRYGTKAGFGPPTRPLNRILYVQSFADHLHPKFDRIGAVEDTKLELGSNRCPADIGYTGVHCSHFADSGLSSYDHYGTSYHANVLMVASAGGGVMFSNSPYLRRLADVPDPTRTVAFQENNGRYAWEAAPEACEFFDFDHLGIHGTVRGWHGKDWTFNAAFIDGHVEAIYMRGYNVPEELENCVAIRDHAWRLDTMTADQIQTNWLYPGGSGRPSWEGCSLK